MVLMLPLVFGAGKWRITFGIADACRPPKAVGAPVANAGVFLQQPA